jgi:excisionase family DNA binding protein
MSKTYGMSVQVPIDDLAMRIEKMPGALTVPELADLLGFSRTTMYDMVARGVIPYIKIGTSIRFDPVAVARWVRARAVNPDVLAA